MRMLLTWTGAAILAFTVGCGKSEERPAAAAAGTGSETAAQADATAAAPSPAVAGSAAKTCLQLAADLDWKAALDPCTQAAKEAPDDLRIRHALQQAQAAVGG